MEDRSECCIQGGQQFRHSELIANRLGHIKDDLCFFLRHVVWPLRSSATYNTLCRSWSSRLQLTLKLFKGSGSLSFLSRSCSTEMFSAPNWISIRSSTTSASLMTRSEANNRMRLAIPYSDTAPLSSDSKSTESSLKLCVAEVT